MQAKTSHKKQPDFLKEKVVQKSTVLNVAPTVSIDSNKRGSDMVIKGHCTDD